MNAETVSPRTSFQLNVDQRRRPTLPIGLLEEAGIPVEIQGFVAYAEGKGRIVLEDPMAMLDRLNEQVLAGMRERGNTGSLVDYLLEERAADTSLVE